MLPNTDVEVFPDYEDALRALDYDQVSAILADDAILLGIIQQHPEEYRIVNHRLTEEPYAAAVVKGDRFLLNAVDQAVRRFKESGAWSQSLQEHFPVNRSQNHRKWVDVRL